MKQSLFKSESSTNYNYFFYTGNDFQKISCCYSNLPWATNITGKGTGVKAEEAVLKGKKKDKLEQWSQRCIYMYLLHRWAL